MKRGHQKFRDDFGGKAFIAVLKLGEVEAHMRTAIVEEIRRLEELPEGPHH